MGLVMFSVLLWPSRSSPPLANATEARLSDRATANSSTMVNFLENFLHPFFLLFRSKRKLGIPPWEPYGGLHTLLLFASPLRLAGVLLPTSMMPRAQPCAIGLSAHCRPVNSGQGDCPSPREIGHLLVSTGGGTKVVGARITRVGLGGQLLPRTPARRSSKNSPSTHSAE